MRISGDRVRRQIAGCLVMLLAVPFGEAATARLQQAPVGQASGQAPSQNSSTAGANPATGSPQPGVSTGNTGAVQSQSSSQSQLPDRPQTAPGQQQNGASNPVGTAAAPYEKTMGVPASRPAGAVIAPAKQRRARSFVIKVGVVVGAAIAIGTVIGMSKASPSRPN